MLVQVIDVLDHAALHRAGHRDVVEHRQMLHVLAQADAAGVRADRDAELRRHQDHREVLVHAAEAAAVDLAEVDRARLQQLLEDDAVRAVLAGRDADAERPHRLRDRRVPEHVVRARRLLDPPRDETAPARATRSIASSTSHCWFASIISVRSRPISSRTSATRRRSSSGRPPTFTLKCVQPSAIASRHSARIVVVGVAHPADRRRVGRIARAQQLRLAIALSCAAWRSRSLDRFVRRQRVGDVAEVDARHDLPRRHVGQQLPHRLALDLGVEIPDRVDDRRQREVDDALLGPEPSQLRIGREPPPEPGEVGRDVVEPLADDEMAERVDRRRADFVAAPDRERQPVPFERRRRS